MPAKSLTIIWLRTILLAVALAVMVWGYGGEDPLMLAGACVVATLASVVFLATALATAESLRIPRFGWRWPALGLLLLTLLSAAHAANRFAAATEVAFAATLILVFLQVACSGEAAMRSVLLGLTLTVSAFSIYGFFQAAGLCPRQFWHNGLFASRYVNSAHFAALAAAAIPAGAGLAITEPGRTRRLSALTTIPVNLFSLMLSRSRAVWLFAAVVYVGSAALAVVRYRTADRTIRQRIGKVAALGVASSVLGLILLWPGMWARVQAISDTHAQGLGQRVQVWAEAVRMIAQNPFGVGAGCFADTCLQYKTTVDRFTAERAHNEILQVTAELGWVAFPLCVWFVVALFREGWMQLNGPQAPARGLSRLCLLASLAIFLSHSLVDFPLRLRANLFFFTTLLAATVALSPRTDKTHGEISLGRGTATVAMLAGIVLSVWWASFGVSAWFKQQARKDLDTLDFAAAIPLLTKAERWMPLDPESAYERGTAAYGRSLFAEPKQKAALQRESYDCLRRAIRFAPTHADAHVRLAWLLTDMANRDEAEKELERAIQCDPTLGLYHVFRGDFLLSERRLNEAAAAYRQALTAFHDNPAVDPLEIFRKLFRATGDARLVRRACPNQPDAAAAFNRALDERAQVHEE